MSRITQNPSVGFLSLFQTSTDTSAQTYLGQRFVLDDGREVALCLVGASALVSGKLQQAPATIDNHQNCTLSTASAGATTISVTLGATAVTANQYAGGYLVINAGTGAGQTLKIASHSAAALSTTVVVTLEDALVSATATASSKGCLIANLYNGVIINPASPSGQPVGVAFYNPAAGTYAFVQTKGPVGCLCDAVGGVVGTPASASAATAGAVTQTPYAANLVTGGIVGDFLQAGVSGEYRTIFVDL